MGAILLPAADLSAQAVNATLKQQQEQAFAQVLREPGNLDASFRYAEISSAVGDYEAAIGALERMLFFNPNLPRVKAELGVLYFRLGSQEMARAYFSDVLASRDTPPEVRAKVEAFLAESDKRVAPNQFQVFLQTGLRYQTNANAGPGSPLVRAFGFDATLSRDFVKRPDWNWFMQGALRHVYDFGNQRGDVWETSLVGYRSVQFDVTRLNLGYVELQSGPRLALAPDLLPGWTIRPYGIGSYITLGEEPYLANGGGGVAVGWSSPLGWTAELAVERARRVFRNSDDYPIAKQQTGELSAISLQGGGPIAYGVRWLARVSFARNDAKVDSYSYRQSTFDVAFPYEMAVPLWGTPRRLTIAPTAGYTRASFDDPNPFVDPFIARKDREWRVGAAFDAQLTDILGFGMRLQYAVNDSNLPNYRTRNFSVFGGPTARF